MFYEIDKVNITSTLFYIPSLDGLNMDMNKQKYVPDLLKNEIKRKIEY